jgi:hypothetical protein
MGDPALREREHTVRTNLVADLASFRSVALRADCPLARQRPDPSLSRYFRRYLGRTLSLGIVSSIGFYGLRKVEDVAGV